MKKTERKPSSIDYFLRKLQWKISVYKPAYTIFALITMGVAIFLLSGGVYDILIIKNPPYPYPYYIYWPMETTILFFSPQGLESQLLAESIIVAIIYALGTLGLLMMYRSVRHANNPRHASIMLLTGMAFTFIAFVLIEYVFYNYKL